MSQQPEVVTLPAVFTIEVVRALYERLTTSTAPQLVLDGAAVERVDTAGLQLLLAALRARATLVHASPALRTTARQLGLAAIAESAS